MKKLLLILSLIGFQLAANIVFANDNDNDNSAWVNTEVKKIDSIAPNINPEALKIGLVAYENARRQNIDNKQILTVIDYSKPSSERRLWVVDLKDNKVLFNTWVAHGKNTGLVKSTSFSNQFNSLKSSIGVFETEDSYFGHDGYSLRIAGLERGINDNALRRNIVFHGASYASYQVAESRGMLGRSWGCMAVGPSTIRPLVNTIKDHTLVVAYYPDHYWLNTSAYLRGVNV